MLPKTIRNGMDIHLAIGGKWNEDAVGTNGIGTALWAGEPVFCRFKDWRRIATRFDRNVKNFMAAISLAAAVIWWL